MKPLPVGLTAIAMLSVGLGPVTTAPVAAAVVTSYLIFAAVTAIVRRRIAVPPVYE